MRLPAFVRLKAQTNTAEMLRRLEDNTAAFAQALTGEKGVIRALMGVSGVGRAYTLDNVTVPDDWRPWNFATNWGQSVAAAFPVPSWRKGAEGRVHNRGLVQYMGPGTPAAESAVVTGGPAVAWRSRFMVDMASAPGLLTGNTDGSLVFGYGSALLVSLSDISYDAADRTPLDWPEASQVRVFLGPDFPGEPQTVLVRDAVTEAGVHLGACPVAWTASRENGQWTVTLKRVSGLAPLATYTLSLAVSA